ncbi:hypothetical protein EK21DRAFT_115133 [Setomelanomma holmii]|uniref:C2H2-type domain-containing protein n=1 Tax=Setomelanomma holmii TaxID=210430 RepID=A0A9P4H3R9_9PLEO|nr:hypothetical protein EK21DRAFT_115133 [Setomelanomma holmii]
MSRHMSYYDDNRVDSATGLLLNQRFNLDHDFEDSQTVSASSVMPYSSPPWSQYNTRQEPDPLSPFALSAWPSENHTFNDFEARYDGTPIFEESFAPIESTFRYTSPDAESPVSYSSSPNTFRPQSCTLTSSAATSSALPTSGYTDGNYEACGQCGQEFTGSYRRGNLARHVRQKHQDTGPYPCTAEGCSKKYKRSDARSNHMRKSHPELRPLPPVQRRRGTEHYSTGPYSPDRKSVVHDDGQHVYKCAPAHEVIKTDPSTMLPSARGVSDDIEQLPRALCMIFATLRLNFDPATYSRICDSFFKRWESVVHKLQEDQSDAYPNYAKALAKFYSSVRYIDNGEHTSDAKRFAGTKTHAPHQQRADPRGKSGGSSASRCAGHSSQTNRVTKRSDRRQSLASGSGKNKLIVLGDDSRMADDAEVECPWFKRHLMNGTSSPCNGCRAKLMSEIRAHLNPARAANTHGGYPAFIKQCLRCKVDFLDGEAFESHQRALDTDSSCKFEPQIRGDIQTTWVRLYLTLFPKDSRVPVPWCSTHGWLPSSTVAECRPHRNDTPTSRAFLGEDRPGSNIAPPRFPSLASNYMPRPGDDAAMELMIQDIMEPPFVRTTDSQAAGRAYDGRPRIPNVPFPTAQGQCNSDSQFLTLISNWETLQRGLRLAEEDLTVEEVHIMVDQAQRTYDAAARMYSHRQLQQGQSLAITTNTQQATRSPQMNAPYFTPVQQFPMQEQGSGPYNGSGISTQPSSYIYGSGSSHYHNSTLTNPSSVLQPSDSMLLSPFSPLDHRRTSLPSTDLQDPLPLRRAMPSRLSLPENQGAASPYLEPSVDETPVDDDLELFIPRRLF